MSVVINDSALSEKILHNLQRAQRDTSDSLAKLSSGQVFTSEDPRPTDRALAQGLEQKLRNLASTKRNINDAVSLLQTAESGFEEIGNMVIRMKEINSAAASSTISDIERRYLMVEYQALHQEIDRVAKTSEFNGIPLLNGNDERTPQQLVIQVGNVTPNEEQGAELGIITIPGLRDIISTTVGLGVRTAKELLTDAEDGGISLENMVELMEPEDSRFSSIYDEALGKISGFRAIYGALQSRLQRAIDYHDVASENIAAARSHIADTDYAAEVARLTQSKVLMQTATALLTQNNFASAMAVHLVDSLLDGT